MKKNRREIKICGLIKIAIQIKNNNELLFIQISYSWGLFTLNMLSFMLSEFFAVIGGGFFG